MGTQGIITMFLSIKDQLLSYGMIAVALQISFIVGVTLRVMLTRHPPGSAFAWILLTTLLPYAGFLLYLLLGERTLGRWHALKLRKAMRKKRQQFRQISHTESRSPIAYRGLSRMATRLGKYPLTIESSLHLLDDSDEALTRLEADIDNAKEFILMEFYIWDIGGKADNISAAIVRAARRGVKCYVLVDSIGSRRFLKSDWVYLFKDANVHLEEALPVNLISALLARADIRLHRKIVVIDNQIGYSGSLNMVDPQFFKSNSSSSQWIDAMVRAKGEIVESLYQLIEFDWEVLTDSKEQLPNKKLKEFEFDEKDQAIVMVVPSGPGTSHDANQRIILQAIHETKKEIQIVTPYFVPGEALALALQNAAIRGVKVTIILSEKTDSSLVSYAARRYFDDLLQSGVEIQLYHSGVLHTKSIVIDGTLSLFGTVNMDVRSLHLNYELMLMVMDREFAQKLETLNQSYVHDSSKLIPHIWYRRSLWERTKEGASYLLSPLL